MNKINHIIRSIGLCIVMLIVCIFPAACADNDTSSRLIIEGQKSVFNVGDEFVTGDDFRVYLEIDGERTEVTQSVAVTPEKRLDMNVADEYAVTVSYGSKKEVYFIIVNDSEPTLTKISADASGARTQYMVGESISYDGLKLIGSYRNAQNKLYDAEITSWLPYRFEVTSQYGLIYDDLFVSEGEYAVKISRGELSATYTVTVEGVNYESVKSGIGLGKYFKKNVVSGSMNEKDQATTFSGSTSTKYTFGDNYTYTEKNDAGSVEKYHVSLVKGKADITYFYAGNKTTPPVSSTELIDGPVLKAWYHDDLMTSYGIEDLIDDLYEIGVKSPNKDYKESVDAETKTFAFSFGRVNLTGVNRHYYWETTVQFTLGDTNFIESATVIQNTWFRTYNDIEDKYSYNYEYNEGTGTARPLKEKPDFIWTLTCEQKAGQRTEKNPYLTDAGKADAVQDYKIFFKGNEVKDGDIIDVEQGNKDSNGHFKQYILEIRELLPEGASFNGDPLFVTDGTAPKADTANWFYGLNFQLIGDWNNNNKTIEPLRGGLNYLEFTTSNTTKKIWFNVTGANPTKLTPQVYNPVSNVVNSTTAKSVGIGETVYFSCIPDGYTNGAFTAALTSGDVSKVGLIAPDPDVTAEEIAADPTLKYWSFNATEAGVYVITMTSVADPGVSATLTVTVKTIDFAGLLNGSYTVEDSARGVYTVKFTPDGAGLTTGQVEISYVKDTEIKVVYEYGVVDVKLKLGNLVSGNEDTLGVSLSVDADERLILTDKFGNNYVMVKE